MGKVENKIVINQAGEDRIVLCQTSGRLWYCKELNHTCKDIELGIQYLKDQKSKMHELLKDYNSQ